MDWHQSLAWLAHVQLITSRVNLLANSRAVCANVAAVSDTSPAVRYAHILVINVTLEVWWACLT